MLTTASLAPYRAGVKLVFGKDMNGTAEDWKGLRGAQKDSKGYRKREPHTRVEVMAWLEKMHKLTPDAGADKPQVATKSWLYWSLLFHCGLRKQDLCRLKWSQEFKKQNGFWILEEWLQQKSKNMRGATIPEELGKSITKWRATLTLEEQAEPLMFPSPNQHQINSALTRSAKVMREVYQDDPVVKADKLNPHLMRHSLVTDLTQKLGMSIPDVAMWVGHKTSTSTERYSHIDKVDLTARYLSAQGGRKRELKAEEKEL